MKRMRPSKPGEALPDDSERHSCPWDELDESGSTLTVNDFLTTMVIQAGNALRRTITVAYAEQFGLSVSEWRILSVLAQAGQLPFTELVIQSATDKAQVSRTLRLLESRGLVEIRGTASAAGKKLSCLITPQGEGLYAQVMPIARRRQADLIRRLSPEERGAMYRALRKLRQLCEAPGDDSH
jgi:DNA-binding MarR family transcriptional regulator